jgi:hypothetical protein
MKGTPFLNVRQRAPGEAAVDIPGCDVDRYFVFTLQSVEVRWRMAAVVHGDHDPEKAADFRHGEV